MYALNFEFILSFKTSFSHILFIKKRVLIAIRLRCHRLFNTTFGGYSNWLLFKICDGPNAFDCGANASKFKKEVKTNITLT